jgi:predicted Zn-dependent peptidase
VSLLLIKVPCSFANVDDLIHFTLKEWTRMSLSPTTAEVERAKSQLKASLLLGLDGTTAIAEDVSGPSHRQVNSPRG